MPRLILVSLLLGSAVAWGADDGWRRVDEEMGVLVEARDAEGSSLHELRATVHADLPPAAILSVLWKHEAFPEFLSHVQRVQVLEDSGDERLVYEELAFPLVRDRDMVFRARRTVDAATGVVELRATAVSDAGPPASSRFVRIRASEGHWRLVPAGGGTDVTYTNRTDVGGLVPDWILNRLQKQMVPRQVRAVLDRAARAR